MDYRVKVFALLIAAVVSGWKDLPWLWRKPLDWAKARKQLGYDE